MFRGDDRDVLAAIGAACIVTPDHVATTMAAKWLVDVDYADDLRDAIERLRERELVEVVGPAAEFEVPDKVRMTEAGWFELWRH